MVEAETIKSEIRISKSETNSNFEFRVSDFVVLYGSLAHMRTVESPSDTALQIKVSGSKTAWCAHGWDS